MVLRRPVKYNPDKRDFVLTESALSNFDKGKKPKEDLFETQSEASRSECSYTKRVDQFGFNDQFGQQKQKKPQA
jgi:hypothetical protein